MLNRHVSTRFAECHALEDVPRSFPKRMDTPREVQIYRFRGPRTASIRGQNITIVKTKTHRRTIFLGLFPDFGNVYTKWEENPRNWKTSQARERRPRSTDEECCRRRQRRDLQAAIKDHRKALCGSANTIEAKVNPRAALVFGPGRKTVPLEHSTRRGRSRLPGRKPGCSATIARGKAACTTAGASATVPSPRTAKPCDWQLETKAQKTGALDSPLNPKGEVCFIFRLTWPTSVSPDEAGNQHYAGASRNGLNR